MEEQEGKTFCMIYSSGVSKKTNGVSWVYWILCILPFSRMHPDLPSCVNKKIRQPKTPILLSIWKEA
jgi:hypothetical protein